MTRPAEGQRGVLRAVLPGRPGHRPRRVRRAAGRSGARSSRARSSTATPAATRAAAPSTCGWSSRPPTARRSTWPACAGPSRPTAQRFGMTWRLADVAERQRVRRHGQPVRALPARPAVPQLRSASCTSTSCAVVSNHPDLRGVAEFYGVPFRHVPVTRETKPQAEAELLELVRAGAGRARGPGPLHADPVRRPVPGAARAGRSTSTTRCCRASRAPGPTTRRTTAG